jgi:histone-lysine N-methyltransferase SETD3
VDLLPSVFRGVPTFFGAESVAALQYPPVGEQVKKRCRWLLTFAAGPLAKATAAAVALPPGETPPFAGAAVDANALG